MSTINRSFAAGDDVYPAQTSETNSSTASDYIIIFFDNNIKNSLYEFESAQQQTGFINYKILNHNIIAK